MLLRFTPLALLTLCLACSGTEGAGDGDNGKADDWSETSLGVRLLDQGWDDATRERMYRMSEGSRMMPLEWFRALEIQSGPLAGQRFASSLNMRRYGFIEDEVSEANPEGLPVGFAIYDGEIGATCTACHSSEMQIGEVPVRIDGGSMRADFARFYTELFEAMLETNDDFDALERFLFAVLDDDDPPLAARNELALEVIDWLVEWSFRLSFAEGAVVPGPGRLDGVGIASNETLCIDFDLPEACDTFNAPSVPGFLWDLGNLSWVQSNGSVHTSIGRNLGQAMGTFGDTQLAEDRFGIGGARVDIPMENLVLLDEGFAALEPPNWRDPAFSGLLPELDEDALDRGEAIYARTCAGCHFSRTEGPFTDVNRYDRRFVEVPVTPLAEIGTDPAWVEDLLDKETFAHPDFIDELDGQYIDEFGTDDPNVAVNTSRLRSLVILAAIEDYVLRNPILTFFGITRARLEGYRESSTTRGPEEVRGYRAQPLEGIAFTGPYLHNGSVRTLAELLRPASERAERFWVGGNSFDAESLGFTTDPAEANAYEFDTMLPGNSREGHEGAEYGTELSEAERADLLEYLRSI